MDFGLILTLPLPFVSSQMDCLIDPVYLLTAANSLRKEFPSYKQTCRSQ